MNFDIYSNREVQEDLKTVPFLYIFSKSGNLRSLY